MAFNVRVKLALNIDAIEIALRYKEGEKLLDSEIETLKSFSGWGGIKPVLYPMGEGIDAWSRAGATKKDLALYEMVEHLHYEVLKKYLDDKEYKSAVDSIRASVLTSFYTPEVVPETLYEVLASLNLGKINLYEPSAGAGVFVTEAVNNLDIASIIAVEKDFLTGKIFKAIASSLDTPSRVRVEGFEQSPIEENGKANLIVSNIPFGNFKVYDPDPFFSNPVYSSRIHNYFFVKGLSKIAEGGIMAYLTTDRFLNTAGNAEARDYLFKNSDFISLVAMPDNLMKDNAGTEAPSHLLIVQKNSKKEKLTEAEQMLVETISVASADNGSSYSLNSYLYNNQDLFIGDEIKEGTNQYGKTNLSVWLNGEVSGIKEKLKSLITTGFKERFKENLFPVVGEKVAEGEERSLTFLPMPELVAGAVKQDVQLGLFDTGPAAAKNEALRYITNLDRTVIDELTVHVVGEIIAEEKPSHPGLVLLQAKALKSGVHYYKIYSNLEEIQPGMNWFNPAVLGHEVKGIIESLKEFPKYHFSFSGDKAFDKLFVFERSGPVVIDVPEFLKVDALMYHMGKLGTIKEIDSSEMKGIFQPFDKVTEKDVAYFGLYTDVRDAYFKLFNTEHSGSEESPILRKELNSFYDDFRERYGALQERKNLSRLQLVDTPFAFSIAHSLERKNEDEFIKADIFRKALAVQNQSMVENISAIDALPISLNEKGSIDIHFIQKLTGISDEKNLLHELKGHIYFNPLESNWEPVDKFISGNVVLKLKGVRDALKAEPFNEYLHDALDAVTKAQPEKIPYQLLDFNLGERWIPSVYYNRFLTEFFNQSTEIKYSRVLDTFEVVYKSQGWNAINDNDYFIKTFSGQSVYGYSLMQYGFDNTNPIYTYTIGEGDEKQTFKDVKATQQAAEKINAIRKKFEGWMHGLPQEDRDKIETLYNETYNGTVIRKFDGRHLKFEGLDLKALGIPDLYDSQKNAIWRVIQMNGGLIDHEVGLGKTLTIVVSSHEMKRLGMVNKPVIICLKSTVRQITETYQKAYPNAKVLAPKETDFQPKKRAALFYEIKNNDWDAIILTHEQFCKIPQSDAIRLEVLQSELDDVNSNYEELIKDGKEGSKALLKGLQVRKENLAVALNELMTEIENGSDNFVSFKEMGIDHLFVDESHKFKNLMMNTRHSRVAGLGNSSHITKKTMSLLYAIRDLQKRKNSDMCATFCSGTPISNSIKEMYLIFKYLVPNELQRMRIENFDSWIAVFGRKTVDFEISVTNEIIAKERFRYFIKVQELALMYNYITDYRRASEVGIDRPVMKEHFINIEATPAQLDYIDKLKAFAQSGDGNLVGYRQGMQVDMKKGGVMLIATNLALKMTADMRLIFPDLEDHPNSKVNQCSKRVAEEYHATSSFKGTQIIFSDIGTPGPDKEFDMYSALKKKLIEDHGIPEKEITFIHSWTDNTRPKLFKAMNDGDIRILIGSTEKAGTGLNVQKRITALHHIDTPWRPSDFDQRNGRGMRQGNWAAKEFCNNEVKVFVYAVQQSLDNYKFNILKTKQGFINQIKSNSLTVRTIDEGSMDEDSGMNYGEFMALLSGDNTLLNRTKLEKQIAVLESSKQTHIKDDLSNRDKLSITNRDLDKKTTALKKLSAEFDNYKTVLKFTQDGAKANPIKLTGSMAGVIDEERLGKYLMELQKKWKPTSANEKEVIGTLYNYDLYVYLAQSERVTRPDGTLAMERPVKYMISSPRTGLSFTYNNGYVNESNPKLAVRYFLNAIDRLDGIKEQHKKEVKVLTDKVTYYQSVIGKPFDKEKELLDLNAQVKEIDKAIQEKVDARSRKPSQGKDPGDESTTDGSGDSGKDDGDPKKPKKGLRPS